MSSRKPARYSVQVAPAAERGVEEIWTYIADDSPENATAFILRLEEQIEALEQHPERCALIPENEPLATRYRHLIYGAYRTIFRVSGGTVFILRIIHGARLLTPSQTQ